MLSLLVGAVRLSVIDLLVAILEILKVENAHWVNNPPRTFCVDRVSYLPLKPYTLEKKLYRSAPVQ